VSGGAKLDGAALASFAVLALVWGYNWVAVKVALDYVAPFTFAAQRCLGGGLLLLTLVALARKPLKPRHPWRTLLLGLLQTTLFTSCTTWALVHGGAGKSAVLVFTMPFWLLLLAPSFLGERLKGLQWLAVLLAFLGLALIFAPWRHSPDLGSSVLAIVGGIGWALSVLVAKRIPSQDRWELLSLTGWQMVLGSLPLLLLACLVPGKATDWTPLFTLLLLYNVVFATALAWALWLFVVGRLPATLSSLSSLVVPIVGVLSGWLQLGEQPPAEELAGMLLIFSGLALLPLAARRS
jgi:drug/metabolite transporter (DMT)-like permease